MPKYLFIQRSQPRESQQPSPTPMQEMYATFNAWKDKFKDNILDMGAPLKPGSTVVTKTGATDGPFVEVKEIVGGYMIVSAETIERRLRPVRAPLVARVRRSCRCRFHESSLSPVTVRSRHHRPGTRAASPRCPSQHRRRRPTQRRPLPRVSRAGRGPRLPRRTRAPSAAGYRAFARTRTLWRAWRQSRYLEHRTYA